MKFVNFISLSLCSLISNLPASPFTGMIDSIGEIPFLGFINYFIPFDFAVSALSIWVTCMLAWRVYRLVRRVVMGIAGGISGVAS